MQKAKLSERITVRLTFYEASRVAALARRQGITPSELARRALGSITTGDVPGCQR